MKRRGWAHVLGIVIATWLVFLLHSCTAPSAYRDVFRLGEITRPPLVQIGLGAYLRVEAAPVAVRGPCAVQGDRRDELRGDARLRDGRIEVAGKPYDGDEVRIVPEWDGTLEVGSRRYHGDLIVKRDREKITLVNEVDLERYLKGVAGKEMSPSAHAEALKAQIIAARTYATYEIRAQTLRRVKGERFDLYDDQRSQVYGGLERETAAISALVDETAGMFVVWEDRVFKAYYASTCGGRTEASWSVMGDGDRIPPLAGTTCEYCAGSKYYEWKAAFSKTDMSRRLFPDDPRAKVRSVRVSSALPGGHATQVAVTLENHSREKFLDANRGFRLALDSAKLRSTLWVSVEEKGEEIVVHGRGFGHGVGMCQVGAYRMADLGHDAVRILEHYYPGAQVKKLY
ncbi:MAG: SpoIID/LytB domain-containing protein [Planctomycetes bacterium]|nr:SpoIID/LytB domain-containing protein [Planctomycetota bacterium]